jgi:hypothetical protein
MTEEEKQMLKIEELCYARIEAVLRNLNQVCFGPNTPQMNSAGQNLVRLVIAAEFLPLMLHLGTGQKPTTGLACETLDFVRTVLSVPEEMIPARLREMAQHLMPEISKQ